MKIISEPRSNRIYILVYYIIGIYSDKYIYIYIYIYIMCIHTKYLIYIYIYILYKIHNYVKSHLNIILRPILMGRIGFELESNFLCVQRVYIYIL